MTTGEFELRDKLGATIDPDRLHGNGHTGTSFIEEGSRGRGGGGTADIQDRTARDRELAAFHAGDGAPLTDPYSLRFDQQLTCTQRCQDATDGGAKAVKNDEDGRDSVLPGIRDAAHTKFHLRGQNWGRPESMDTPWQTVNDADGVPHATARETGKDGLAMLLDEGTSWAISIGQRRQDTKADPHFLHPLRSTCFWTPTHCRGVRRDRAMSDAHLMTLTVRRSFRALGDSLRVPGGTR